MTDKSTDVDLVNYQPLFVTIAKKNTNLSKLTEEGVISSATQAQFKKNEPVRLATIAKVCRYLNVPIEEVVEVNLEDHPEKRSGQQAPR